MVLFWSFVAGFSEKFVTNIISQFESPDPGVVKPESQGSVRAGVRDVTILGGIAAESGGGEIASCTDKGENAL